MSKLKDFVFVDYETMSGTPIALGPAKYCSDPEFSPVCMAWALVLDGEVRDRGIIRYVDKNGNVFYDDGSVVRGTAKKADDEAIKLFHQGWDRFRTAVKRCPVVFAHNAKFDRTVFLKSAPLTPKFEWRCSMHLANANGLPGSLEEISNELFQNDKKDMAGNAVMRAICVKPKEGDWKYITQEDYTKLCNYCLQDVMLGVKVVLALEDLPHVEKRLEQICFELNDRGLHIDVEMCRASTEMAEAVNAEASDELRFLTKGYIDSPTQRERFVKFLTGLGAEVSSLGANDVSDLLDKDQLCEDPFNESLARALLEIRLNTSNSSISKFGKMADMADAEGIVRDYLRLFGAMRTMRFTSEGFQGQNIARGAIKDREGETGIEQIEKCMDLIRTKDERGLRQYQPKLSLYKTMVSCLRSAIQPRPGYKFLCADYAGVEYRLTVFCAGQQDKVNDLFMLDKTKDKAYESYTRLACVIYAKQAHEVSKDERQLGKVGTLGSGYGIYPRGFQKFCKTTFNMEINMDTAKLVVNAYRSDNPKVVEAWHNCEEAFKNAVLYETESEPIEGVTVFKDDKGDIRIKLRCGGVLTYVRPEAKRVNNHELIAKWRELSDKYDKSVADGKPMKLSKDKKLFLEAGCPKPKTWFEISSMGIDQQTKRWVRKSLHGGAIFGQIIQSTAFRIMEAALVRAWDRGYKTVLSIHDELLAEVPDTDEYTLDEFRSILEVVPEWLTGFPLKTSGWEGYFYRKD